MTDPTLLNVPGRRTTSTASSPARPTRPARICCSRRRPRRARHSVSIRSINSPTSPHGARPTKPSAPNPAAPATAEALMRRADAGLPHVNRLTDLYNAISVLHQIPVGGEDLTRYAGAPVCCAPRELNRSTRWHPARQSSNTPTLVKWCGATTQESPAAAGTGDRPAERNSLRTPQRPCSFWTCWTPPPTMTCTQPPMTC